MGRILDWLTGTVVLEITGPSVEVFLNRAAAVGQGFRDVVPVDSHTVTLTAGRHCIRPLERLAEQCGCICRVRSCHGLPFAVFRLRRRWALWGGALMMTALLVWSSLHIWEIEVMGNETVSDAAVLNALDDCGVGIGSFWPAFTSDNIRSEVLVRMPELQWMTVNVYGSRAEVLVREAVRKPVVENPDEICDVVAARAGLVTDVRVLSGQRVTEAGKTALPGETLISGAVESSFSPVRLRRASGEIYARTWYDLTAQKALQTCEKGAVTKKSRKMALILGEKRINFYESSGILGMGCDKLSTEYRFAIPGVFTLPVGLEITTLTQHALNPCIRTRDEVQKELEQQLLAELHDRIGETGQVNAHRFSVSETDGVLSVTLHAACVEQIGERRLLTSAQQEQILRADAESRMEEHKGEDSTDD